MNEKMRGCVMGLLLGQFSSPLPEAQKEPAAYLYNGVRLPALPEWDRETYPYAVLEKCADTTEGEYYALRLCPDGYPYVYDSVGIKHIRLKEKAETMQKNFCYSPYTEWTVRTGFSSIVYTLAETVVWSNTDIRYAEDYPDETLAGTVFLTATDPIPVYE